MARSVTEYRVLIASPGDVAAARQVARDTVLSWNDLNAGQRSARLSPIMWETHSAPEMGERPQAIINRQIVDDCDIAIGLIWTRLGTPTGIASSGTVEELERLSTAGKRTSIYFCMATVNPYGLDSSEFARVQAYRSECETRGLLATFETTEELREKLLMHLTRWVDDLEKSLGNESTTVAPLSHAVESATSATTALASHALEAEAKSLAKSEGWYSLVRRGKYAEGMATLAQEPDDGSDATWFRSEKEHFARLIAFEEGGEYQAFVDLELHTQSNPEDAHAWFWYGIALAHARRTEDARDAMRHVISSTSNSELKRVAVNWLSASLFLNGDKTEALALWRTSLSTESDPRGIARYLHRMADMFDKDSTFKDVVLATSLRELALDYVPSDVESRLTLAWQYGNDLGALSLSLFHYLDVLARDPSNGIAAINSGWVADKMSLAATAVKHYRDAQKLGQVLALTNMGWLLLGAGFTGEAEDLVAAARKIDVTEDAADRLAVAIRERQKDERGRWEALKEKTEKVRRWRTAFARAFASPQAAVERVTGVYSGTPLSVQLSVDARGNATGSFNYSHSTTQHIFTGTLTGKALLLDWTSIPTDNKQSPMLTPLQIDGRSKNGRATLIVGEGTLTGFSIRGSEAVDATALEDFEEWDVRKV